MTTSEKIKSNCPQLYYMLLDWKDKHFDDFYVITGYSSLNECDEEEIRFLINHILKLAFKNTHA